MSNPTFDIQPDGRSDRNLALSTVKKYAAVISACHESYGERSVFVNPRVKCFLKGNRKTATCHAPLGITVGINSVSTCSRESSFQVFNTNPSQIAAFQNIYSLNHNFGKESEWLVYALHLYIPHRNDMENASHHLCRCTSHYVARTAGFRQTLFNRERSQGNPLTKQRLSGCLKPSHKDISEQRRSPDWCSCPLYQSTLLRYSSPQRYDCGRHMYGSFMGFTVSLSLVLFA